MLVFLVRHAHAGGRWSDGRDRYRPLSPAGQDRAQALASLFADRSIDLLWSSPATRCLQTLGPLAQSKGLQIVEHPNLAEGADTRATLADLDELIGRDGTVVACSHGDIIPPVIDQLAHRGVEIRGRECEVGSLWALEPADGQTWRQARYIPPEAPRLA